MPDASSSSVRSQSGKVRRVVVVGGGLAGLMTVIKLCEAGVPVDVFSLVPVRRSHSVGGGSAPVPDRLNQSSTSMEKMLLLTVVPVIIGLTTAIGSAHAAAPRKSGRSSRNTR